MADYAPDVPIVRPAAPLQYSGADAIRRECQSGSLFPRRHRLDIETSASLPAVSTSCYSLNESPVQISTALNDRWWRATIFSQDRGKGSLRMGYLGTFDMGSGKALLDLSVAFVPCSDKPLLATMDVSGIESSFSERALPYSPYLSTPRRQAEPRSVQVSGVPWAAGPWKHCSAVRQFIFIVPLPPNGYGFTDRLCLGNAPVPAALFRFETARLASGPVATKSPAWSENRRGFSVASAWRGRPILVLH